jgi:hypothetical protein
MSIRLDPATGRERSPALQAAIRARLRAAVEWQCPRRVRVAVERTDAGPVTMVDATVEARMRADDIESAMGYELGPEDA